MHGVGKRVGDHLYVHVESIDHVSDKTERATILEALDRLPSDARAVVNVAKLNVRSGRVALLEYVAFDEDPFPVLASSWTSREPASAPTLRTYADSLNPPILHRKELLVDRDYPNRDNWARLTTEAEALGLFDDVRTIGFRMNWDRLIASKGYELRGETFAPLGNAVDLVGYGGQPSNGQAVQRHLTALARSAISAPVQLLLRHGLLRPDTSFFDYGCGRGDDLATLLSEGFNASGWDPHYAADRPKTDADVVNVGFVVNVVEDPSERVEVLQRAFALTKRVMSVGVMLYGSDTPGRPFRDGFLTSRSTFQKYFSQGELKDYIESVLDQEAFPVGPGVAIVFKDKDFEQTFLAGRYRRRDVSQRLLAARFPERKYPVARPRVSARSGSTPESWQSHPLLQNLWRLTLDLGRLPEEWEAQDLQELVRTFGTYAKAIRKVSAAFDPLLIEQAGKARADDLLLFFAVQQFKKRPRYRQLEQRMQSDVRAFFGDYGSAQAAGLKVLGQAAKPDILIQQCQEAASRGLGWLEGDHLQLHVSLVERLPVCLRVFISCGLLVYGDLSEIDLVKVHAGSAKLTLMQFDDFASSPTPLMARRVKINVRQADYDLFDYGGRYPKPPLYHKSRYMHEEMQGYVEQQDFDETLDATGILPETGHGPSGEELANELAKRRLEIQGYSLRRSTTIPELDDPCGKTLTYRSLIECGETRARLHLPNLPRNPATYNALYDLAVRLLDPLVDYFGSIRLTYGFCSAELAKHITSRVAPRLDQHACLEVNSGGNLICARGGAACDFLVEDEDMSEVANWIMTNLPYDRLYFYGDDRPIHVSYAASEAREAFEMRAGPRGRLIPKRYRQKPH